MKKLLFLVFFFSICNVGTGFALKVVNRCQYPINLWVPYPNAAYEANPNLSYGPQFNQLLNVGDSCEIGIDKAVQMISLNVSFHPEAMKRSIIFSRDVIDFNGEYEVYIVKDENNIRQRFVGSVLDLYYDAWTIEMSHL